jgi:hypothetical protein
VDDAILLFFEMREAEITPNVITSAPPPNPDLTNSTIAHRTRLVIATSLSSSHHC